MRETKKTNWPIILLIGVGLMYLFFNLLSKDHNTSYDNNMDEKQPVVETDDKINGSNLNDDNFAIKEIELNNKHAFRVIVGINNKLPNYDLQVIASKVKSSINAKSDIGVVFFILPEMISKNGAWAAVDFTPVERVRIIGKSLDDEKKIKEGLQEVKNYVGLWVDNGVPGNVIIRIRKDKEQDYVFEYISSENAKPSDLASPLKKIVKNGKTIFIDKESTSGDYYVIDRNGDLIAYDQDGFIATFSKLK